MLFIFPSRCLKSVWRSGLCLTMLTIASFSKICGWRVSGGTEGTEPILDRIGVVVSKQLPKPRRLRAKNLRHFGAAGATAEAEVDLSTLLARLVRPNCPEWEEASRTRWNADGIRYGRDRRMSLGGTYGHPVRKHTFPAARVNRPFRIGVLGGELFEKGICHGAIREPMSRSHRLLYRIHAWSTLLRFGFRYRSPTCAPHGRVTHASRRNAISQQSPSLSSSRASPRPNLLRPALPLQPLPHFLVLVPL